MIIKCGKREFDLNKNDEIMYNGACYQIITKKYFDGWYNCTPMIAKGTAEKLIKQGKLVFKEKRKYTGEVDIYKIKE